MSEYFDARETRAPEARERDLLARLPAVVAAALTAPGWRRQLGAIDPQSINSRAALARLPVLRKSDLAALQKADPPLAGLISEPLDFFGRVFASPGPIFEPEGRHDDPGRVAPALFAAGIRRGDVVLNTFSYHLTPGGFMLDAAARALGCVVIPAGPGNTKQQLEVIAQLRPAVYSGTPDFLKILLDAAEKGGRPACFKKAVMSGAAFPASLQAEIKARGVDAYQAYATADLGLVAYETAAREGLVVAEDVLLEIVRPGTGDPVEDGEVGEVVVTLFDCARPLLRFAMGDLSAVLTGTSPCGRTNVRIMGWMGRADQTAKVKGMFVRPEQVAEIARRHRELGRVRLVIGRQGEVDTMTLKAESSAAGRHAPALIAAVEESLREITKLGGSLELVAVKSLPNDGIVIDDQRPVD